MQAEADKQIPEIFHRELSGGASFRHDVSTGRYSFEQSWTCRAAGAEACAEIELECGRRTLRSSAALSVETDMQCAAGGTVYQVVSTLASGYRLTQEFRFFDGKGYFYTRAGISPPDGARPRLIHIRPMSISGHSYLALGHSAAKCSVYNLGFQSWTPAEAVPALSRQSRPNFMIPQVVAHNPLHWPAKQRGRHICDWFAAVKNTVTSDSLLCGFVTMKDMHSHVFIAADHTREKFVEVYAQCDGDSVPLSPGVTYFSEWMFAMPTRSPLAGMYEYADAVSREMSARVPEEIPVGWCSWYKYFTNITQKDMLVNLEALAALADEIPVKFFQIDDGYQKAVGDWLTLRDDRFPGGMAMLASRARSCGFEPGIWVAPFFARKSSRLFNEHRNWFVKERGGGIAFGGYNPGWGGPLASLDLTNPEVLDWLGNTFDTIVNVWGYKYLKLDFLYSAVVKGVRRDGSITRAQAYRRGLEVIRRAAGEDAFILGCGAPLGPSVGICDAMRIGTDTAPAWRIDALRAFLGSRTDPGVETSLLNCMTRSFLHGRLWANDPDCILLRKGNLTHEEYRTFATVLGLTGGMVLISDDMRELDDEGRRVFSLLCPPCVTPAVPADLFESVRPSLYSLPMTESPESRTVAAINWKDTAASVSVDFAKLGLDPDAEYNVFSFWDERFLGTLRGGMEFSKLPAHGCKLLRITPAHGVPAPVGSSLHITCGAFEIQEGAFDDVESLLRFTVSLPGRRDGKVFIFMPEGYRLNDSVMAAGGEAEVVDAGKNIVALRVQFDGKINISIGFRKDEKTEITA